MTAINSCIEVDLTGQVNSDSIGTRMYSGFGGQVDFIRGAAEGLDGKGKPIIALPSVTKKNQTKITPVLKPGNSYQTELFYKFNICSMVQVLVLLHRVRTCITLLLNTVLLICSENHFDREHML